jgi:hypothetical protein
VQRVDDPRDVRVNWKCVQLPRPGS